MNGYKAFYGNREIEIYADTMLAAKNEAVAKFKAPRSRAHMVSVVLCEKDGVTISHSTAEF